MLFRSDLEDDDDTLIAFVCQNCNRRVVYDLDSFDSDDEHLCPKCGGPLFEQDEDEDEE